MAEAANLQGWSVCRERPRMAEAANLQGWSVYRERPWMAGTVNLQGSSMPQETKDSRNGESPKTEMTPIGG